MTDSRLVPPPARIAPPSKHQLALMIWVAALLTLTALDMTLHSSLNDLPVVLRAFILATVAVPIVIDGVMPHLHRLRGWLITRRAPT